MVESTETASWLPLGSALVIDWKHLGRPAPQRGATAWVAHLDGEPVILRAWGEDTTSYFDFAFLADERLAGTIIVACSRAEPGRLRVKTAVEVEGFLTYADTCEFKEHPRTMLLTPQNRALETKQGVLPQSGPPRIEAQAAEIFEIAPDGALVTRCGHWVAQILRMARDLVQGREAQSVVPRAKAAAPAPEPVRAPVAAPAAPA
ncbi:hypothetical protein L6R52_42740, partial [Myxococcota bacterium]|nr:hypothetical protein [Myxococcota bacterium]